MKVFVFTLALLALISQIEGHGALTGIQGTNDTPRDCAKKNPCQRDTSIIRTREIASGKAGACGRTLAGGNIDMQAEVSKMMSELGELPTVKAGAKTTINVHQVNQDGAGPFNCEIDMTGTGENFQNLQIAQNVKGFAGLARGTAQDNPLVVQMPQNLQCTGGENGNMCMIRCRNPAAAGPFGGCIPVAQEGAGAAKNAPAKKAPA
ncbi:hypothetical protein BKA69DRAFT_1108531 [Paraphysoderma sedebokerense]|nr:hypothetical protein BKA69DRAFT_1108531 [Paraphysoderma sedebokerense]